MKNIFIYLSKGWGMIWADRLKSRARRSVVCLSAMHWRWTHFGLPKERNTETFWTVRYQHTFGVTAPFHVGEQADVLPLTLGRSFLRMDEFSPANAAADRQGVTEEWSVFAWLFNTCQASNEFTHPELYFPLQVPQHRSFSCAVKSGKFKQMPIIPFNP